MNREAGAESGAGAVVLRRARAADARAAADVWLRSFAAALPTVVRPRSDTEVRAYFRHVVVERYETWLAEGAGGAVAGVMVLEGEELSQLYLAPERRGCGIGDRFVALAKERRADGLSLWTFQVNAPARRFYERHGFTPVQWTDGARNEEREPDVRYVWRPRRP
ncbi:GNAT family N-acetyltransferase [Streptomyces sp. RM72]|uniref:GNAT family N-acetyltransferase n=1 Tax=unclassified Streptomyces TaxID=2593676 RepID=UPI000979036F|nr:MULTISPECIES: GNAT family N-acetyltransferase [unclassified Streptomyces]MBQ0886655.1 GNAT family N-acetyltransferase [Streptomyces sp. RM72]OMI90017.1 histone acetyltransferase [Streptomyces sp. M1013]